jgi:putative ABC transport system ATP-binding protein
MSTPLVAIENLRFAYHSGLPVLDIGSFRIERGERVFLRGPSGSGKTTLLGILAGVLAAKGGKVEILGQDLVKLSGRQRDRLRGEHIGYIFQQFNLIPYLSVIENIVLACRFNQLRAKRINITPEKKAAELCEHLGISAMVRKPVTELSVGQQQRVAAARALIGAPELIIADEPTSALDTDHREAFIKLLFQEADATGSAILFVSHDPALRMLFTKQVSLPELNRAVR